MLTACFITNPFRIKFHLGNKKEPYQTPLMELIRLCCRLLPSFVKNEKKVWRLMKKAHLAVKSDNLTRDSVIPNAYK